MPCLFPCPFPCLGGVRRGRAGRAMEASRAGEEGRAEGRGGGVRVYGVSKVGS